MLNLEEVIKEMNALKDIGVKVPKKAFSLAENENLSDYENMSVSEAADMFIAMGSF